MRLVRLCFVGHLLALTFGLGGLLIALRSPDLWSHNPLALRVYAFGMHYGGSLHILFGMLTMLLFGLYALGARRTLTFFVATVVISLSSELIGTSTGWPFGNYAYTSGLGFKILGRVPFTIPLSWFYMGFASYLLASRLLLRLRSRTTLWPSVLLGAYFLVVWDLVLDPAMAHPALTARFWVWERHGPYFGMPIQNFAGWAATAVLFMAVSRWLWRSDLTHAELQSLIPLGIYLANITFASALSISVHLWVPVVLALVLGVLPAIIGTLWPIHPDTPDGIQRAARRAQRPTAESPAIPVTERVARTVLQFASRFVSSRLDIQVSGWEHVPATGPVILACRHYHHLYDATLLMATSPRPLSFLVALDWATTPRLRWIMEHLCACAGWPVVLRIERLEQGQSAYRLSERSARVLRGVRDALQRLCAGEALVVFPEGFPNIDPHWTPKRDSQDYLPFRPGFVWLAQRAAHISKHPIPIVPVGLAYTFDQRWRVSLNIGEPILVSDRDDREQVRAMIEAQVHALSTPLPTLAIKPRQQLGQGEA